jgi:hypothetical protein
MFNLEIATKDIILTVISGFISWLFTHTYYRKSLKIQNQEFLREIKILEEALDIKNSKDQSILNIQYIGAAVKEWEKKGTPKYYIDSLDVSKEQKAEIYQAASLRHKRCEPKNNPYLYLS